MKPKLFFALIFLFLFSVSLASAQPVALKRGEYIIGETVQAEVEYAKFAVSKLSLLDGAGTKIPVTFFNMKLDGNRYFVYFNIPLSLQAGNYTFRLKDRLLIDGELKDIINEAKFTVAQGSSFTIKPAILNLDENAASFKIELKHSAGSAIGINLSVDDTNVKLARKAMAVSPGETKFLFADYTYGKLTKDVMLTLSFNNLKYDIPLIVTLPPSENETEEPKNTTNITAPAPEAPKEEAAISLVDNLNVIEYTAKRNATITGPIRFITSYSKGLHNVRLTASPTLESIVEFNVSHFQSILPNQTYSVLLNINKKREAKAGEYFGSILITSDEGASTSINVELKFEEIEEEPEPVRPKLNVSEIPAANLSINYSELNADENADKGKSLRIAIIMIALVIALIALIAYRLKPRQGYTKMEDYIKNIEKPGTKKKV